jgi:hypothetical protein
MLVDRWRRVTVLVTATATDGRSGAVRGSRTTERRFDVFERGLLLAVVGLLVAATVVGVKAWWIGVVATAGPQVTTPPPPSTEAPPTPALELSEVALVASAGPVPPGATDTPTIDVAAAPTTTQPPCTGGSVWQQSDLLAGSPAGIVGGDYPHAYELGGQRVLWLLQDVFFAAGEVLSDQAFAHNAGFVEEGACPSTVSGPVLGASTTAPRSFLGGGSEVPGAHWFWPLDGELGIDGDLWIFVAEMSNPAGTGAREGAEPVGTWLARIDPTTLAILSFDRAPDASAGLFGWSVVTDGDWSYLYGHCYRQFVPGGVQGTDPSCSPRMHLARVPAGRFDQAPEYFDGIGWSANRDSAYAVMEGDRVHAASVERVGATYVAITKRDDWFGSDVVVETAPAPQGPWQPAADYPVPTKCELECVTYGTFLLPWRDDLGRLIVLVGNNTWDMRTGSYNDPGKYHPTVWLVPMPS